jgi:hypothetical protein
MPQSSAGSACRSLRCARGKTKRDLHPISTELRTHSCCRTPETPTNTDVELAYGLLRAGLGLNIVMHGLARLLGERDVRSETGPCVRESTATELVSLCFRGCLAVRRDPSGFTPTAGIEDTLGPGERMRIALRTHLRIVTSAGLGDHGAATGLLSFRARDEK